MAISASFYFVLRDMFKRGMLPTHCALLELGEANWYDNISAEVVIEDIKAHVADPARRDGLIARMNEIQAIRGPLYLFDIVKVVYDFFFQPAAAVAVDFEGTPSALKLDLNHPLALERRFDVLFNHGTAEHIFNIGQVFKTMHDHAAPGALMFHESPFTGWIDHGFYALQPTLFFDMAAYNEYVLMAMFVQDLTTASLIQILDRDHVHKLVRQKELPENSMLLTVLKNGPTDQPFRYPIQGFYRGSLSAEGMQAWKTLR